MKIKLARQVEALHGSSKGVDLVFCTRYGKTYAYQKVVPDNPRTSDQNVIRDHQRIANIHWGTLSEKQRQDWQAYAERYFRFDEDGQPCNPRGIDIATKANMMRQLLGLPLVSEAPLYTPPLAPLNVACAPCASPREFGIIVQHDQCVISDYAVAVRLTPATVRPSRKPLVRDARCICHVGPQSTAPLAASGECITFSEARFAIEPGQRFGLVVRIVRISDGIPSEPFFKDLVR